jgi:hypothetical protein
MREHIQHGLGEMLKDLSPLEPGKDTNWRLRKEAAP